MATTNTHRQCIRYTTHNTTHNAYMEWIVCFIFVRRSLLLGSDDGGDGSVVIAKVIFLFACCLFVVFFFVSLFLSYVLMCVCVCYRHCNIIPESGARPCQFHLWIAVRCCHICPTCVRLDIFLYSNRWWHSLIRFRHWSNAMSVCICQSNVSLHSRVRSIFCWTISKMLPNSPSFPAEKCHSQCWQYNRLADKPIWEKPSDKGMNERILVWYFACLPNQFADS